MMHDFVFHIMFSCSYDFMEMHTTTKIILLHTQKSNAQLDASIQWSNVALHCVQCNYMDSVLDHC